MSSPTATRPVLAVGDVVLLREANNTHAARGWTVTAVDEDGIEAEGKAWPGATSTLVWSFRWDAAFGAFRHVIPHLGSTLFHTSEPEPVHTYRVEANGTSMGCYRGVSEAEALEAYARDAGYRDLATLIEEHGDEASAIELALPTPSSRPSSSTRSATPCVALEALAALSPELAVRGQVVVGEHGERSISIGWDPQVPGCEGWATEMRECGRVIDSCPIDSLRELAESLAWLTEQVGPLDMDDLLA